MGKKVLVLSTGLRRNGNSHQMAQMFAKGAAEAGHEVEQICLSDKKTECCRGCQVCQKTKECVIRDDMVDIIQRMKKADVIAFATPVYFYGMCGNMKNFLDRTYPLYTDDYCFRDIYLLAAAGEDMETTVRGTVEGLNGWIRCFEQVRLADVIFAGGVLKKGEIEGHPALEQSCHAGKKV